ncbi:MAG: cupin domain-containing protein [Methyloprofundus sp.]|nr:cupin domain-containing protein [Methyloprofundus sp.]
MAKETIKHYKASAEFYISEDCYINELWNSATDTEVSIARARVLPAVTTKWHRLEGIVERYVILEGQGRVEIGGQPATQVTAGDVVVIPAMSAQRIANTGSEDLVFLAICSPRFVQSAYQELLDET